MVANLVNQHQSIGKYSVQFNASNLPSGVYIYQLQAGEFKKVNKMLLFVKFHKVVDAFLFGLGKIRELGVT